MGSVLLAALAVAAPVVSRRVSGDLLGPVALVGLTWGASAALARLAWIPYHPVAPSTWSFLFANLLALMAGLVVAARLGRRLPGPRPASASAVPAGRRWVGPFAAVGLAGLAWYIAAAAQVLGCGRR